MMLGDSDAIATIAVKDIKAAADFYGRVLNLKSEPSEEECVLTYASGSSKLLVYESNFAGTNQATAVTWAVPDVAAVAASLKANGVIFEHYDMPSTRLEGDVHISGNRKNAWFKDPDGNVLGIVNQ